MTSRERPTWRAFTAALTAAIAVAVTSLLGALLVAQTSSRGTGASLPTRSTSLRLPPARSSHAQEDSAPRTTALGIYDGTHTATTIEQIAAWLGSPGSVRYALEFLAATSWTTISQPSWVLTRWHDTPYEMVWGVPMMPCGNPTTMCGPNGAAYDALARGADNHYFVTLAQNLVAAGQGASYIRLGWELNGTWFPWSVCTPTGSSDFVPAFRNIVTAMRSVSGANFTFIWNPGYTSGGCGVRLEDFYPGDAYVTVVALDVYDEVGKATTPQNRWEEMLDGLFATGWAPTVPAPIGTQSFPGYGLNWLAAFAAAHDKAIGLPEWGLATSPWGAGGDDRYFVTQMAGWIKGHVTGPCDFWDSGFGITVPGVSSSGNPLATAAFKAAFGGAAEVAAMASAPTGSGYWQAAQDGAVHAFGGAVSYGTVASKRLARPVVAMAASPDGKGYWLAASDGGVFSFGDASFHGSMGGSHLNRPIVGMAPDVATGGYWEVASDGGVFSFGAPFEGSSGGSALAAPVVGMAAAREGGGYWVVAADGATFPFGSLSPTA